MYRQPLGQVMPHPKFPPAAEARSMLARNLDGELQFYHVSRAVNSVKNQGGDCIEPIKPL